MESTGLFLMPAKHPLGHLMMRQRKTWTTLGLNVLDQGPPWKQNLGQGLMCRSLFWKVSLGTGDWVVSRGRRGNPSEGMMPNIKLDTWDAVPLVHSEEPSRMHLRIIYQHLSTSSDPLWFRGSPRGVNCLALLNSMCLSARQAPHKHPLLKNQRCTRAENNASTFIWAEKMASVMAGTKEEPAKSASPKKLQ